MSRSIGTSYCRPAREHFARLSFPFGSSIWRDGVVNMAWEDLPRFEPSKASMLKLREKWKWGPCYAFSDDGLGVCMRCGSDCAAHQYEIFSAEREKLTLLKREMTAKFLREMTRSEAADLFAEPVVVPAAIEWFLRWMEFRTSC